MKKARAMYIPAGGKKAVWGPVDQNVLPEGYPYKEQSEVVVLAEQTVAFSNQGGQLLGGLNEAFFVSGNTYKIIWDGTAYVCTATEIQGSIAIGNLSIVGSTGNNEPFAMTVTGDTTTIMALEGGTEHTVSISEYAETIHPMAPEFLPAGVGGGGDSTIPMIFDPSAGTFACDLTFDEALEMGSAKLARLLELRLSGKEVPVVSCTGVWKNQTSAFGVHFCIEFGGSPIVESSTTYTDGEKIVVVWHTNGIAMLTAS